MIVQRFKQLPRPGRYAALSVCLLAGTAVVVLAIHLANRPGAATSEAANIPAVTHTTDTPSESKAEAAAYNWRGGTYDPKRIQIPAISVDTFVQRMDVDQNQEIAAPDNIHLAGWFVQSVRPGEKGLSIIDGHLNGRVSKAGVFGSLDKLHSGDTITITRGNGTTVTYRVTAVQNIPVADVPSVLFSQDPANAAGQLNLITCSGTYDSSTQRYDHRVVVSAVLQTAG